MDIILEAVTENNIGEITEIYNHYVIHTTASYAINPVTVEDFKRYYKFAEKRTVARVIYADKKIIGFCLFKPFNEKKEAFDGTCEFTIYIAPEYCGKGIGKRVYGMMEKYLIDTEIKVVLAVICAENIASCKMFESIGFELSGNLKNVGKKFGRYLDLKYFQKNY